MKEIGLLFTSENRQLVRLGHKTQTRRDKGLPAADRADYVASTGKWVFIRGDTVTGAYKCPYENPQVEPVHYYLKEPVQIVGLYGGGLTTRPWAEVIYPDAPGRMATSIPLTQDEFDKICRRKNPKAKSNSMFMLKAFSRTWREGVRTWPERLGNLSTHDAIAEGIEIDPSVVVTPGDFGEMQSWEFSQVWRDYLNGGYGLFPVQSYASLWESINGPGSWHPDKWVWCVEWRAKR